MEDNANLLSPSRRLGLSKRITCPHGVGSVSFWIDDWNINWVRGLREARTHGQAHIGAGLEAQNQCAEIKLRAERKAGKEFTLILDRIGRLRPVPV